MEMPAGRDRSCLIILVLVDRDGGHLRGSDKIAIFRRERRRPWTERVQIKISSQARYFWPLANQPGGVVIHLSETFQSDLYCTWKKGFERKSLSASNRVTLSLSTLGKGLDCYGLLNRIASKTRANVTVNKSNP